MLPTLQLPVILQSWLAEAAELLITPLQTQPQLRQQALGCQKSMGIPNGVTFNNQQGMESKGGIFFLLNHGEHLALQ